MADLEQMYVAVILNGALRIKLMSSELVRDLLQKPPKSKPSNSKMDIRAVVVREAMRLARWIGEKVSESMIDPPSFEEWQNEGLLNLPTSPSLASS